MKTKVSIIAATTLLTALSTFAESRIWTDTKGNSIEAEYILQTGDKVVLRLVEGNDVQVSLNTLSAEDQDYILRKTPPKLELDVNLDVDRSNSGNGRRIQVQTESMSAKVIVKKTGTSAYDAPLFAEIFLIGKREYSDDYVVMEHAESEFKFATKGRDEYVYTSGNVSSRKRDGAGNGGMDFKGYLALVRDQEGQVIAMKASKPEFASFAESISTATSGNALSSNFEVVNAEESDAYRRRRSY